jgi:acyl-CoA thioesterase FadM
MERLTIVLPEKFHFTTQMPVLINDINLGNHVGNDAFVRYINEAFWRFSGAFNISRNIIMADLAILFRSEAFYGDILKCEAAVSILTKHSCYFYCRMSNSRTGKEIIRSRARIIFFDYTQKKPVEVPEQIICIRPIWHQKEERVRAHILVCFLAYVLWKTLGRLCRQAGLGDEPRKVFQELSQIKLTDVILPTRNGKEIKLRCVETPSRHQGILLQRLKLNLPKRFVRRNL